MREFVYLYVTLYTRKIKAVQSTNFMEIAAVNDGGSEFKIEEDFVVKEEPNCAEDDAEQDSENVGSILCSYQL